jgi:hypothetical protein
MTMFARLLTILVLVPTAAVVLAMFVVMWRERTSARDSWIAGVSGGVLAVWAVVTTVLASRGFFLQPDQGGAVPPVGINLVVVFAGLATSLAASPSLRRLLTNQQNLIRLNMWRLEGFVFLMLMVNGQMPALWALPAGIGDILVGVAAPWVASRLERPEGRRRAIIFNLFGVADLIVAVGLGIMTSPGPAQHIFRSRWCRHSSCRSPSCFTRFRCGSCSVAGGSLIQPLPLPRADDAAASDME